MHGDMTAGVSVRWLVEQRPLGLVVLAGARAMDRRIEWAHSIELTDPTPWLRGGELLLTTGLRLAPDDPHEHRSYIGRLTRAGVAALGFGVGLTHARVPDELVLAADSTDLPLLEVPLPTPFIAVIRAVTEQIAEQQYEPVTRASRVQPRMTRAALRGGGRAVVRELAAATGGEVLFLGPDGQLVSAQPPSAARHAERVVEELRLGGERATGGSAPLSLSSSGPTGAITAQRMQVGRRRHGFLALLTPAAPTPVDHLLLGHAASLICLDEEKPLRLRETQNRFNEMLVGLLSDGTLDSGQAAEQLRIAGLAGRAGLVVLSLGGPDPRGTLAALDRALLDRDLPCIGAIRDDHAVVLLPCEPVSLAQELLDEVGRGAPAGLSRATDARDVSSGRGAPAGLSRATDARDVSSGRGAPAGLSRATDARDVSSGRGAPAGLSRATDTRDLAGAIHESITAARVAGVRGGGCVEAESMAGHALIALPATRAVLDGLAEKRLRPLADADRLAGSDLVGTLRAFLEHNGHWEAAASSLGIHRHTLNKRVGRIQVLLGVDLDSAHVRAELLLCLTAWSPSAGPRTDGRQRADPTSAATASPRT